MCTSATLRREVDRSECRIVVAPGFRAAWSYHAPCRLRNDHNIRFNGAFLNLETCRNSSAEGILIPVTDSDITWLDERERGYQRVSVRGVEPDGSSWAGYTYRALPDHTVTAEGSYAVARNYVDLIERAVSSWGSQLHGHLESQAFPIPHPIVEDPVEFASEAQQRAARRGEEL